MRTVFTPLLRRLGLALALLVTTVTASAHSSSNSYLALSERDGSLVLRTDIHLRDVDLLFDLDNNRDGAVSWGETATRSAELQAWIRQGLALHNGTQACALEPVDVMASERSDGHYLSAEWSVACPGGRPDALSLRYGLIFERDALHRGLVKVDLPGQERSAILSPDQPEAALLAGEVSAWSVLGRYTVEGVWHIWIGIDHILFLLSLLVLAPLVREPRWVAGWHAHERARPALLDVLSVVTAFTIAHSITLCLAILQVVEPPAKFIEPVIALSVVLAALNNLLGWFSLKRWRLAFVFGLIHGFGFANVLLDLDLPAHQLAVALGGFNLGVELGQLAIVGVFFPLAWWLRHTALYRWVVVAGGSMAIAIVGTVWIVQRMAG